MREMQADVVIIGGGVGGCAAALAAASSGMQVIMTEETDWIGGQFTSQAVPPDEHRWIEEFGSTALYRQFRDRIRDYYRRNFPLSDTARASGRLNPGNGDVSRLCHEPRVAVAVLYEMLAPHYHSGRIQILLHHVPALADVNHDRIRSVSVRDLRTGDERILHGEMFLDATELGDLLPLTGAEYVTGAESQSVTGELHALPGSAQPLNMQAFTFCMVVDYFPREDYTIERPSMYPFWCDYVPDLTPAWTGRLLSWIYPQPATLAARSRTIFNDGTDQDGLWTYRRIIDRRNFSEETYPSDLSTINWPQVDYWLGPICEVSEEEKARHLRQARQLSLSFLYWMQTEAPRPNGGAGYPGLRLRSDVTGTTDGLAKYPYVRESRRIQAQFTVLEEHVGMEMRRNMAEVGTKGATFFDSVGIGHYNIDLHPSTGGNNYIDIPSLPFQIPLGSMIPVRLKNLLPVCKNIGTTHITNGCYRLHPVEWNLGETGGYLAAYCIEHDIDAEDVWKSEHLQDFQRIISGRGIELAWPSEW